MSARAPAGRLHPILVEDEGLRLVAAAPAYLKSHSQGNMCSTTAGRRRGSVQAGNIIRSCRSQSRSRQCRARACSAAAAAAARGDRGGHGAERHSSAHITFIDDADAAECEQRGWLIRHGVQYHWFNRGYSSFEDFLAALTSRKRKTLRKERAAPAKA